MKMNEIPKIKDIITQLYPEETQRIYREITHLEPKGIFMTGVENSDPMTETRRNQLLEADNFYQNYKRRLKNIKKLGIRWLRFGEGYSFTHIAPGTFNFALTDKIIEECERLGITVVLDLLHFGLPDWIHQSNPEQPYFQNAEFPLHFESFVRTICKRYPHIRYFTPVNEPYVTAFFSSKLGIWNEKIASSWEDDRAFVRSAANIAKASVLAKKAIEEIWQEEKRPGTPLFFQNESFEVVFNPQLQNRGAEARRFNLRRFAVTDLIFGQRSIVMEEYLLSQGLSKDQYEWFMANGTTKNMILGVDHYTAGFNWWGKKMIPKVPQDGELPYLLHDLVVSYWHRYPLPIMHMEVNAWPVNALLICQKTYDALVRLRQEGYPILGMTWFGDNYQVGWQSALAGETGHAITDVGLYYVTRLNTVGNLFADLAKKGL